MIRIFLLAFIFNAGLLEAQDNLTLFTKTLKSGFVLYASNKNACPVSLFLDLELTNLKADCGDLNKLVVPERTDSFKVCEMQSVDARQKFTFSYKFRYYQGNIYLENYDSSYVYDLPYGKGKAYLLSQGYDGRFSHQNEYALDFTMEEGTEILAARDGIVVNVVQNNTQFCALEECKKYSNHVIIYHADGTFAIYAHLRFNGAIVKTGDIVKKGDRIAFSGNTGWTSGPHLHFSCYLPRTEKGRSIPTKFYVPSINAVGYLVEKTKYSND